jgi:hypothetical protein
MIKESGHFAIQHCNITSCVHGLYLYPSSAKDVQYGFVSESLFDSCGTTGVYLYTPTQASPGRLRSIKFTGCWLSGANTAGAGYGANLVGASNGVMDDISFTSCRFLNNGYHGINYTFGTNVRISDSTISGNSQAASNTYDGINIAAAVSDFEIVGNRIGMAGTATNTQRYAIYLASGASARYQIIQNDVGSNNTAPFIFDGGTTQFKRIHSNLNSMPSCTMPALTAAVQALSVGAQVVTGTLIPLPVNGLMPTQGVLPGTRFIWDMVLTRTTTAGTAVAIQVKFGNTGGTGDTAIATWTFAGSAAVDQAVIKIVCDILTLGSGTSATARCNMYMTNSLTAATGIGRLTGAPTATAGFDSTVATPYIHVGCTPGSSSVMTCMASAMVVGMG